MIRLVDVGCRLGRRWRLRDVSLGVAAGEALGVTGPNGSGKTLLLQLCATLVAPTTGTLEIAGVDATRRRTAARRLLGFAPDEFGFAPGVTVREDLAFFAGAHGLPRAARAAAVADALAHWALGDLAAEFVDRLSRGSARRLVLARATIHQPRVLLLDDPVAGLDAAGCELVWRELARHVAGGGAAIVTAPDGERLQRACARITAMTDGTVSVADTSDRGARRLDPIPAGPVTV